MENRNTKAGLHPYLAQSPGAAPDVYSELIELKAYVDGMLALLSAADGALQMDGFAMMQLWTPVGQRINAALAGASAHAH